jgi:hypothetical protein
MPHQMHRRGVLFSEKYRTPSCHVLVLFCFQPEGLVPVYRYQIKVCDLWAG